MSHSLENLTGKNKELLLLAEGVGWLHDISKCSDEHIKTLASDSTSITTDARERRKYNSALDSLNRLYPQLEFPKGTYVSFSELRKGKQDDIWLVKMLEHCHNISHTEKAETFYLKQQAARETRQSTPFGYESAPVSGLTDLLDTISFNEYANRPLFRPSLSSVFTKAFGDTRRPINDVSLWDWSSAVAAFYKAAIAYFLLNSEKTPDIESIKSTQWRLLSIRFNRLQFIGNAVRISDVLARQKLLDNGLQRVRTLLENTYPLGTEIYHDENGSIFVIPNDTNILDLKNKDQIALRNLILEEFGKGTIQADKNLRLNGEVEPLLEISSKPWPEIKSPEADQPYPTNPPDILPLVEYRTEVESNKIEPQTILHWWKDSKEDICPVCNLRPQGWAASPSKTHQENRARGRKCPSVLLCPVCKALDRKICTVCEQRREDRSREWIVNKSKTIWLDEVADRNGRLALIVGSYEINPWLDGTMLFYPTGDKIAIQVGNRTSYKWEEVFSGPIRETGTPVRSLRVLETTYRFWKEVISNLQSSVGSISSRLHLYASFTSALNEQNFPVVTHVYDLKIGPISFSVTCVAKGEFLTSDNLSRVALLMGAAKADYEDEAQAVDYIQNRLLNGQFEIVEPTGYGSSNKSLGTLHITNVTIDSTSYVPAISILSEPSNFMIVVPANKALEVAKAIREKYEREMGKVRNRLPLTLGLVFAGSRTPLPAILDAGRRMLKLGHPTAEKTWCVKATNSNLNNDTWAAEVKLTLQNTESEQQIVVSVPTVMGDQETPDVWYPYWCVVRDKDGKQPSDRLRQYKRDEELWVHVCSLQVGDIVQFIPSIFDFELLDTAARRFEISYDNGRRRGGSRASRPYYLEQLREFDELWKVLQGLASTQIDNLIGLIEMKREEWKQQDSDVFAKIVHDILHNANYKPEMKPREDGFRRLHQAALRGQLADVVELYITIMKSQTEVDRMEAEKTSDYS